MNTKINTETFLLIQGCPRSGTYLLSAIMNAHKEVAIPVETHFIPIFYRYIFLWGDLRKYNNRKRLIDCIFDFLEIFTVRNEKGVALREISPISLLAIKNRKESIAIKSNCYEDIIKNMFKEYAEKKGSKIYGDKCVFYRFIDIKIYEKCLKNIKIIHIIRDGRDVCLSWMKTWFGPKSYAEAAKRWVEHINGNKEWGKQHPEKYLEIKYEDLVIDTDKIIKKICDFIKITDHEEMLNHQPKSQFANILSSGVEHKLLSSMPQKNNIYKWKTLMSEQGQIIVNHIAEYHLNDCQYELSDASISKKYEIYLRIKVISSKLFTLLSAPLIYRQLKSILPFILLICSHFNIPLKVILNRNYK